MTEAEKAYAAAEELIAKAIAKGWRELDFFNPEFRALEELPPQIAEVTGLEALNLNHTMIRSLDFAFQLPLLKTLRIEYTDVSDLGPIQDCKHLETLLLEGTNVHDLGPISSMTWIRHLDLIGTPVTELSKITHMTDMLALELSNTAIDDFTPISMMKKLERLYVDNTSFDDVSLLAEMHEMNELDLNGTKVSDLRPLIGKLRLISQPFDSGLVFKNTPASQSDKEIARISKIRAHGVRARELFSYLEKRVPLREQKTPLNPETFVFLSYARKDQDIVSSIHSLLGKEGLARWWDQDVPPGGKWREEIATKLNSSASVLTLWTKESTISDAVREEAATAQKERRLVHARLDESPLPFGFSETNYVDLRSWDGTPTHPQFRKLIAALKDACDPPNSEGVVKRIARASPIEMVRQDGKLRHKDTPVNIDPPIINIDDLDARLEGLRQALPALQEKARDRDNYQFPTDLTYALNALEVALTSDSVTWYALNDARLSLCDCMDGHDAKNAWNDVTYKALVRVDVRITELQPLLQPEQIPAGQDGAKPPEAEPIVANDQVPELGEVVEAVVAEVESEEGSAVIDRDTIALLELAKELFVQAEEDMSPDRKFKRMRSVVKRMTYVVGGIVAAITGGVMVNLLTAKDAAIVLADRLAPLFERLIQFFL